jgi:hypothetical protein
MGITPPDAGLSYRTRLRQYERRERMILWVGAGLLGLIGLVTSDLTDGAPKALTATAGTLIVLAGTALAYARVNFEWAATKLSRAIEDGTSAAADLPQEDQGWPTGAEGAWYVGLLFAPLAGLVYLAAIWWAVV